MIWYNNSIDDDAVDGARLSLWTLDMNGPTVHHPGDIWAWTAMVEWNQQGKTPDLTTRALWHLVANQEQFGKGNN
jgi:hypothetical protein